MPDQDSIPDPTATGDVYPVTVTVRSGERSWSWPSLSVARPQNRGHWGVRQVVHHLGVFAGTRRVRIPPPGPKSSLVERALNDILNMAQRYGLNLQPGERR